ncbi:hypothetical protein OG345_42235 (plasmid) [Streptomyces sp. NBC_01220]|uniref:hypothetical protein n=1 Tax=Streptomyces sp. NBC_01220 TaxID=2903781 RepID=UPI00352C3B0E|nr:hypothetical protein OG345_42235 [Streptomyces sp. NBC_01220]
MLTADLLISLGIDLAALDPAPQWTPRDVPGLERLKVRHPCVCCGQPSTVVGAVEAPGFGRRWVDRCTRCLVAMTPRGRSAAPLEDTLDVLRKAVREAELTIPLKIVTDKA